MVGQVKNALDNISSPDLEIREEALFVLIDHIKADAISGGDAPPVLTGLWSRVSQEPESNLLEIALDGINTLLFFHPSLADAGRGVDLIAQLSRMDASCLQQALPLLANLLGDRANPYISPFQSHENGAVRQLAGELI